MEVNCSEIMAFWDVLNKTGASNRHSIGSRRSWDNLIITQMPYLCVKIITDALNTEWMSIKGRGMA